MNELYTYTQTWFCKNTPSRGRKELERNWPLQISPTSQDKLNRES